MNQALKHILLACAMAFGLSTGAKADDAVYLPALEFTRHQLAGFPTGEPAPINEDLVIVDGDTIPIYLPSRNLSRYDRGLRSFLFVPKGRWEFGLTASWGELNTEDIELLQMLTDLNFKGNMYAIRPSIQYFFRHNQSVGMKIVYSHAHAALNGLGIDIDDDMNFHLSDVEYSSSTYAGAICYRNYVGLDRKGRFAVFNEADLSFSTGSSDFTRLYNEEPRHTHTRINEIALNFSPGVCVYIMNNVNFNLSFGVFGLKFKREHQTTNGIDEGTHTSSGANFRFNIFNINFGIGVNI
ncbi:MAG: hypothetical protein K2L05_07715 [Muribaculaceae bacterium]|nr:hypothetical protein [Muribaculaceae bacterium]